MPSKDKTNIASVKHNDKRANLSTQELRDFVVRDEDKRATTRLSRETRPSPCRQATRESSAEGFRCRPEHRNHAREGLKR